MNARLSLCMLGLAPVLGFSGVVTAQGSTPATKTMAQVQVTAQADAAAPQLQQRKLTATDIEQQQIDTLTDVVRMLPGVNVSDAGRFGSNGFNIRGVEGDRVKLAIDGMPLGETLELASNAPYDFFRSGLGGIDPDALKQVTILKGADAITAGSGALGGAVLFQTKDAADYLEAQGNDLAIRLKTGYSGNNNEWLYSATTAARVGKLETLWVITHRNGEELKSFDRTTTAVGGARTSADPLQHQSANYLLKLQYEFLPDQQLKYSYDQFNSDSVLDNLSRIDQTYLQRQGIDDTERLKHSVEYLSFVPTWAYDSLQLRYDNQKNLNHGITRMRVTTPCPQNVTPCLREEDRNFRQENNQWTAAFDKVVAGDIVQQQWTYGAQIQHKTVDSLALDRRFVGVTSTLATIEVDPAFVPHTAVHTRSLYARNNLTFARSAWSAVIGARYDTTDYRPELSSSYVDKTNSVKAVDFGAASAQAQLHYTLADDSRISAQIGRGFRAPSVENMYLATQTTSLQEVKSGKTVEIATSIANPDLKPEYSVNTELAYQFTLGRSHHSIAVFRDRYQDMISTESSIINASTEYLSCGRFGCVKQQGVQVSSSQNIGEATVKGLEVSGDWQFQTTWQLHWSASHQTGEEGNGRPLNSVMPWSAALGVGHQLNQQVRVMLNSRYQAAKDASDTYQLDATNQPVPASYLSNSALISDASLQWQPYPQLQLNVGIFNLFNQDYYRWEKVRFVSAYQGAARGGVSGDGIRRYLEPGRYGKASLTIRF